METLLPPPNLVHLFTLTCTVSPPLEIGPGPYGRRRCIPITSGTVRGKYLSGEIVPGGADFMLVEENQTTHVNTNYVIKSHDGAYIYVRTEGTRSGPPDVLRALMESPDAVDPDQYWFHLHIKLETGHEKYRWMNNRVVVGRATRAKGEVAYDAYFLED
ncbi:hypothetical protein BO94DRAFT_553316 [Aspergillus sclerotioniger CBS 115572]|uniref:Uncharacterized protein n=1 Tax=Aspergillus sclerotioniger CBS 115572 TaxID=1450535 RepID=A0A317XA98_9EURO|nr:hypothetical protein BO94DRAFT_553316 [Aspergillus sclerotioniger CBS 115572]PWY95429.1 hypothetical protein BO94DRAFT_553316 [Aspergillus sclerotioniger CBS 115572]